MNVLDKVIEKYTGVHRRSIVENDVQNIYDLAMGRKMIYDEEFLSESLYYCECLQKEIVIDVEQDDIEFAQCYGDINKITLIYKLMCRKILHL